MGRIFLGVDIGTTSAKCLAVNEKGKMLSLTQQPYQMAHPHECWAEQDPHDYWRAVVDVISRCVSNCTSKGYTKSDIVSLAMSTQGDTLILIDKSGIPLYPAISWMDTRGEVEFQELIAETGKSFWYKSIGKPLSVYSSACNLRWLQKHVPDIWKDVVHVSYVADYLAFKFCGTFVSDVPSASWTQLYSPAKRNWSNDILKLLDISAETLPKTRESGKVIGELLPDAADDLGLDPATKLIAGAFDQAAAAYGTEASADGRSILSCGTAWVLYTVTGIPVADSNQSLSVCCHVNEGEWGMVLPFTGGSAYDWLHRTFGGTTGNGESAAEPPVFIPHLYGGLSPDWHGESKGSLLGLTIAHTWEDVRLALMHGLAFESRRNLEAAEREGGRISSIRMVGGAGKSEIWPRIIANVLNRPVEVSDCVESACYGAAKLAARDVSSNWTDTACCRVFEPASDGVELEENRYQRYLKFYQALLLVYGAE